MRSTPSGISAIIPASNEPITAIGPVTSTNEPPAPSVPIIPAFGTLSEFVVTSAITI